MKIDDIVTLAQSFLGQRRVYKSPYFDLPPYVAECLYVKIDGTVKPSSTKLWIAQVYVTTVRPHENMWLTQETWQSMPLESEAPSRAQRAE